MASIYPHRQGFRAQICLKGHPRMSRTFAARDDAEAWAKATERELRDGGRVDPRKRTLAHAIRAYLESPVGQELGVYERNVLAWWDRQLGRRQLQDLKRGDFYDGRDRIRGNDGGELSPATINRRVAQISAVLTMAMDRDFITWNPARIRRLREKTTPPRLPTAAERDRLIWACLQSTQENLYPIVVCAMLSGARASELCRLTWADVDLEQGIGRVTKSKSGKPRPIPLRGPALELLRAMAEARQPVPVDHVFGVTNWKGSPLEKAWHRAKAAAEVQFVWFHHLRHLAASELAMAGTSTREIQQLLGHESAQMTARYAHFVAEHTLELGDRLNRRLFGKA